MVRYLSKIKKNFIDRPNCPNAVPSFHASDAFIIITKVDAGYTGVLSGLFPLNAIIQCCSLWAGDSAGRNHLFFFLPQGICKYAWRLRDAGYI